MSILINKLYGITRGKSQWELWGIGFGEGHRIFASLQYQIKSNQIYLLKHHIYM